jgi:hypothetical protein
VQPAGCWVADAHGRLVPNKLFAGAAHPGKLESYQHRADAAEPGASLARDVRGSWAVRSDALKGVTTLRRCVVSARFVGVAGRVVLLVRAAYGTATLPCDPAT